jgi:phosphoglycolate phosphatase-like HAD superfamily hydrolase
VLGLPDRLHACLFDFDGVLTKKAKVHAVAWKEMFDAYPWERAARTGERFRLGEPGPGRNSDAPAPRLLSEGGGRAGDDAVWLVGVSVSDRQGGLDECGVGEGLGIVAEVAVVVGVDLLGQEAERVDEF